MNHATFHEAGSWCWLIMPFFSLETDDTWRYLMDYVAETWNGCRCITNMADQLRMGMRCHGIDNTVKSAGVIPPRGQTVRATKQGRHEMSKNPESRKHKFWRNNIVSICPIPLQKSIDGIPLLGCHGRFDRRISTSSVIPKSTGLHRMR